jgi:hypothetical protein
MVMVTFKNKMMDAWLDIKAESTEIAEAHMKELVTHRDHWTITEVKAKKGLFG